MKKYKNNNKKTPSLLSVKGGLVVILSVFSILYVARQVLKKPTEVISVFAGSEKLPQQTWQSYSKYFIDHSTNIMTPSFLAALAQVESAGNPFASPEWRFNFNASLMNIFKPSSTSVGLLQFTEGTFKQAKKYCIRNHQVKTSSHWYDFDSCWFNDFYTRLSASHSIEMTSAYLHQAVERVLENKPMSVRAKQFLAAAIHLCGEQKIKRSLKGQRLKLKNCGSHRLRTYMNSIRKYQTIFSRYTAQIGD